MSIIDQCPSTAENSKSPEKRRASKADLAQRDRVLNTTGGVGGAKVWRSADEYADTREFRDFVEREFPSGASELLESSRRGFLQVMGASLALAGAATMPGCRQPDHKILPYSKEVPEEIVPGKPLFYATSTTIPGGGAEGLLIETHEGRPTKVEGNPLHSVNRGKSSIWAQSSVLDLYDPDRPGDPVFNNPVRGKVSASWDDFRQWANDTFAKFDSTQGAGLAIVAQKKSSPSREFIRGEMLTRWPKMTWVSYDAVDSDAERAGVIAAFGEQVRQVLSLDKAKVVLSLDRDFLNGSTSGEPHALVNARNFAATRRVTGKDDPMSRFYMVESAFSITGAQADHRMRLAPSQIPAFAVMLAKELLNGVTGNAAGLLEAVRAVTVPAGNAIDAKFVSVCAEDLRQAKSGAVVLAGPTQPAAVHALCHAINAALGNVGTVVKFIPASREESADSSAQLKDLAQNLAANQIDTLVCLNCNPVYNAPPDLFGTGGFAAAYAKVKNTVSYNLGLTETGDASTWALNATHDLESWGDTQGADDGIAPIQPMIAPLFDGSLSDLELLTLIISDNRADAKPDGYQIVRTAWKALLGEKDFDKNWRRSLQDGVVPGTARDGDKAEVNFASVAKQMPGLSAFIAGAKVPTKDALDVVFRVGHLGDGRFSNNAWLQELPDTGTRNVWDNPAVVSPQTAKAMGIEPESDTAKFPEGVVVTLAVNGRSIEIPVWILPGIADNTVLLTVGYGRRVAGRVGDGVGFDVFPLRNAGQRMAQGATLAKTSRGFPVSSTQNHWWLEGRTALVRAVDRPAFQKFADETVEAEHEIYGRHKETLNFAERLGELAHTPPNVSAYENPYNLGKVGPDKANLDAAGKPPAYSTGQQWGMTIDLSTCTGCNACTIACQAENNIPVVGKKEVAKGREMTWIRVDRYFTGDDLDNPGDMLHQPVACVHCENAPCEVVCPVNATIHGPEGINYMTYNRCIGTRYCANNCPYKVRRFNFFDYGVTKFNGDYYGRDIVEKVSPERGGVTGSNVHNKLNVNLIPPRLRQKLDEISRMQKNPNVTVRSRGVMEKCSYCIQRINAARIECKVNDLRDSQGNPVIPDAFLQTACQQACPSESIVFGDILNLTSAVSKLRNGTRSYALLGFLNTRPRTSYLVRVRNPNPALVDEARKHAWENPFHHGAEHEGAEHGGAEHGKAETPHALVTPRARRDGESSLSLRVLSSPVGAPISGGIGHGAHA